MKFPFIFNRVETFWGVRDLLKGYVGDLNKILPNDVLPLKIKFVKCITNEITFEFETNGNSWFDKNNFYFEDIFVYSKDNLLLWEQKWNIYEEQEYCFFKLLNSHKNTNGIVIGAHDGTYGEWVTMIDNEKNNLLLIEPTTNQYEKLTRSFGDKKNIKLIKTLVSTEGGDVDFYEGPTGFFNSMNVDHLKKYTFEDNIIKSKISSISMIELLKEHENNLDWIHIDTEGYDAKLILSVKNEKHLLPRLIVFEHNHITIEESHELELFFKNENYKLIKFEDNTFAIK